MPSAGGLGLGNLLRFWVCSRVCVCVCVCVSVCLCVCVCVLCAYVAVATMVVTPNGGYKSRGASDFGELLTYPGSQTPCFHMCMLLVG